MHYTTTLCVGVVMWAVLRVLTLSTSATPGVSPAVVVLSTVVSASMLLGIVQDTDLLVCYSVSVLGTAVGLVLLTTLSSVYARSSYIVGHVYIGQGQTSLLRVALGYIEVLSSVFRSVSLSLRIVCNATAGHVLLAVLVEMTLAAAGPMVTGITYLSLTWLMPLVVLKGTTCVIQGVVLSRLLVVY